MINELKEKIAPYAEKYNLRISDDNDFLSINNEHFYSLDRLKRIEEDDITIVIRSERYAIYLFKRVNSFHAVIY